MFYRQHLHDLHFISSETMLVEQLEKLTRTVARAVLPDREPREAFPTLFAAVDQARKVNKHNWPTRQQVAVARYVDNFLVYVSDLIGLLFRARPEALRSQEQVKLDDILMHPTIEDLIEWLADEKVNELSYKGFGEIAEYFARRFGLELVEDTELRRQLIRAIATRNLLVHRRGRVDSRFVKTLTAESFDVADLVVGEELPRVDHFAVVSTTLPSVKDIEPRVISKFKLPTVAVTGEAWWP